MLNPRSLSNLKGVNNKLVRVVTLADEQAHTPFIVTEGLRSKERQLVLFNKGASRTLNSMHIVGRAVDLAVVIDGEVRWDWPLYYKLADTMKAAAALLNIKIEWGGDWTTFKDGPHFQLGSKE